MLKLVNKFRKFSRFSPEKIESVCFIVYENSRILLEFLVQISLEKHMMSMTTFSERSISAHFVTLIPGIVFV